MWLSTCCQHEYLELSGYQKLNCLLNGNTLLFTCKTVNCYNSQCSKIEVVHMIMVSSVVILTFVVIPKHFRPHGSFPQQHEYVSGDQKTSQLNAKINASLRNQQMRHPIEEQKHKCETSVYLETIWLSVWCWNTLFVGFGWLFFISQLSAINTATVCSFCQVALNPGSYLCIQSAAKLFSHYQICAIHVWLGACVRTSKCLPFCIWMYPWASGASPAAAVIHLIPEILSGLCEWRFIRAYV